MAPSALNINLRVWVKQARGDDVTSISDADVIPPHKDSAGQAQKINAHQILTISKQKQCCKGDY